MKKLLSAFLALALGVAPAVPAAAQDSPFTDVPSDHWAFAYIRQANEENIITGMGDGTYLPDGALTAAQFAAIVIQAFYWRDLDLSLTGPWYAPYQKAAEDAGVMEGVGVEDWDAAMTRYQMARLLYNIALDKGIAEADADGLSAPGGLEQIPEPYRQAVLSAYRLGLLSGMGDGSFAGEQSLTRAQAAVIHSKLDSALLALQGPMERVLDKAERRLAQAWLSYSFDRYPGPNGTAYVARQSGTPHGVSTTVRYVDRDGTVLDINDLLPNYFMYGPSYYLEPREIRFSGDGGKLTFITPVREGKGGMGGPEEVRDWGDTLCTVDLTAGIMESMTPLTPLDP